jgi:hypothetical protein
MKYFFSVLILLGIHNYLSAQNTDVNKVIQYAIHADAGFAYLVATNLNLEKAFSSYSSGSFKIAGRVGLGYIYIPDIFCDGSSGTFASMGLSYFVGPGNHHLELSGGGQIKITGDDNNQGGIFSCDSDLNSFVPLAEIGYRYQKPNGGFLLRIHIGTSGVAIGLGTAW